MTTKADARTALAINLELGGRRAASVRVELVDEPGPQRVVRVALSGWIDRAAERRLERALAALAPRAVTRVVLDCSRVSRLDGRDAERLVEAVSRFEVGPGPIEVRGLPRPRRDRPGARARGRSAAERVPHPELSHRGELAS